MGIFPWHMWVGLIGMGLVLLAFFLLQGHRLQGQRMTYQLMNALGALGVLISLVFGTFNLSAFLLEAMWLLISIYGMAFGVQVRRTAQDADRTMPK